MKENDIYFNKEEKLFMILGFTFVLLVCFIVFPSLADTANQKETEFDKWTQNFFAKYQSYDDIETDYIPNENIHITVIEEYPSGKMVSIQNNTHSIRYFIKKDMSYYRINYKKGNMI